MSAALPYRWTGEAFEPLPGWRRAAARDFAVGETYRLEEVQERSVKSHDHQFAWLTEAWKNLPENIADLYPTPESLRKRALIEGGYYNETIIDCGSKAAALRVAAFARGEDEFALVITRGAAVVVRKAKSQSRRAMTPAEFQASKTSVLGIVSAMVGVSSDKLASEAAGKAA